MPTFTTEIERKKLEKFREIVKGLGCSMPDVEMPQDASKPVRISTMCNEEGLRVLEKRIKEPNWFENYAPDTIGAGRIARWKTRKFINKRKFE